MKKVVAAFIAVAIVLLTATGAAADPIPPGLPGPLGTASELMQYKIAVTSEQLYDTNSTAAKASWAAQEAKYAAQQAGAYRAGLIYNNVGAETLAGVTPINGFKDRLTPMTRLKSFTKVTAGGVGSAAIVATIFTQRADLEGEVTSWFGGNAADSVCSDPVAGGHNPINWLTGQDCDAWRATAEMQAMVNHDQSGGSVSGGEVCAPGDSAHCLTVLGGYAGVANGYCVFVNVPNNNDQLSFLFSTATSGGTFARARTDRYDGYPALTGGGCGAGNNAFTASSGSLVAYCVPPLASTGNTCDGGEVAPLVVTSADPARWLTCAFTFMDGSTSSLDSVHFHESQLGSGSWPQPICPPVPSGKVLSHMRVSEMGGSNDPTVLQDEDTADTYRNGQGSANSALCDTQACILDLLDVHTGHSCFSEADTCSGWFNSSTRDADYQCTYGGQNRGVQSCYVYANVFNSSKRLAGDAYADPHTGNDPGSGTSLNADEQNMGRALQSPAVTRDCFGGTYSSFNPLEWVVKPLQCGLEWAFVPRQAVVQAVGVSLQNRWGTKAPGQLAAMIGAWHFAPSLSGCSIVVPYSPAPGFPTVNIPIVDACSGPMATLATLCRLLVSIGFTVMVFLAIKRAVGGMVDYQ